MQRSDEMEPDATTYINTYNVVVFVINLQQENHHHNMGPFRKPLLFLVFVIMATCDPATSTNSTTTETLSEEEPKQPLFGFYWYTVHMVIVNNLGGDNLPLTVHCKSKNDDLQAHVIDYKRSFRWHFRPNFWGTTLFFCHFSWSGGEGTYDIYKTKRDSRRCTRHCDWYVTQQGVEGYTEDDMFLGPRRKDIVFKWKNQ
ncbi:Plant self-incompatibility S1 [Vigna unguiculata]|uniref:S-protein homolog n=1 Tax=Vigna unguiculata TaxID=3917 RepID=A0A4D6LC47_VIGUN|nr:Plant self-incompatibility S1 [Vigna unguiculata]